MAAQRRAPPSTSRSTCQQHLIGRSRLRRFRSMACDLADGDVKLEGASALNVTMPPRSDLNSASSNALIE